LKRFKDLDRQCKREQKLVMIDKQDLESLSDEVLAALSKTAYVLTSNDLDLSTFLDNLKDRISD